MGAQVVQQHQRDPATRLRAFHRSAQVRTQRRGRPLGCPPPVEPAVAPVDQAEAVLLGVVARRLDQALTTASLAAPHPREGGVQRHFDLVLQGQVGSGQQAQQPGQILGHLVPQQRVWQEFIDGWRLRRCRCR